jgi:hypothetical protein
MVLQYVDMLPIMITVLVDVELVLRIQIVRSLSLISFISLTIYCLNILFEIQTNQDVMKCDYYIFII